MAALRDAESGRLWQFTFTLLFGFGLDSLPSPLCLTFLGYRRSLSCLCPKLVALAPLPAALHHAGNGSVCPRRQSRDSLRLFQIFYFKLFHHSEELTSTPRPCLQLSTQLWVRLQPRSCAAMAWGPQCLPCGHPHVLAGRDLLELE